MKTDSRSPTLRDFESVSSMGRAQESAFPSSSR